MADLSVDLDAVGEVSFLLSAIREGFENVHPVLDAGGAAFGSGDIRDRLFAFGHGWVDGRRTITGVLGDLQSALTAVAEELIGVDAQLAKGVPSAGAPVGGGR